MTLYEAIKHAEEVAEANERSCKAKPHANLESYLECAAQHRQLAEWLKELKQLREQTSWIPVSERLPNIGQRVLVTYNQEDKLKVDTTIFDRHGFLVGVVTAWMPLPPCYEPQESEEIGC